jgi:hypothetical protein
MSTLTAKPQIDYTDKDYDSLRRALLNFARLRLPEWTDRNPADFGMLMVDLFAYMGDVILYYQDRLANEMFLETALERSSIVEHLRLIGYELAPPQPASAELDLIFDSGLPSVVIPTGAQFRAANNGSTQIFEYLEPNLTIQFGSDQVEVVDGGRRRYARLPVRQGVSVATHVIGSATAEANQSFPLSPGPVIADTLLVEVNEGAGWVRWDRRDSLLYDIGPDGRVRLSTPNARHYTLRNDAAGGATIHFGGDGRFGRLPTQGANNIRASYVAGGGSAGNVPAGTIREALTPIPNLARITNPAAAAGGQDAEFTEDAVRAGPMAFRARQRAVTLEDYGAMAHLAGGVAKARARAMSWNHVDLYIAPAGPNLEPVPETLRRRLLAFFEDRRMAGTFVRILGARPAVINISAEIAYDERYRADAVRQALTKATQAFLAFESVDFGQPVYLSALHDAIARVPGVRSANISRFRRSDRADTGVEAALSAANLPPLAQLPAALQAALLREVEADGRIELAFNEIPVLGDLRLNLTVAQQ